MKKWVYLLSFVFIFSFLLIEVAQAGLVNYGRRKSAGGARPAPKAAPAPAAVEEEVPEWKKELPEVQNQAEDRYDINRDGKLQTAEVKIYLRDVITEVSEKGGYSVDSDVLKKYDKNRDGVINKYELTEIRQDVNG